MIEFNEPTGTDVDATSPPTTAFNEPIGTDIIDETVKPEAKTAGGVSLETVPESGFFDLLKAITPSGSSVLEFATSPTNWLSIFLSTATNKCNNTTKDAKGAQ